MIIRKIKENELQEILDLYKYLHPNEIVKTINNDTLEIWNECLQNPLVNIFIGEYDNKIITSCVLVIVPNLTRGARHFSLVENVITHPDYRKRGYASSLLNYVIDYSKKKNCYKIMLLSSKDRVQAHLLYEKLGFDKNKKFGFILELQ